MLPVRLNEKGYGERMGVVMILVAAVLFIAGMVVSVLGIGWLGALLCTVGAGIGLAILVKAPRPAV
jgi:hypothetical protein